MRGMKILVAALATIALVSTSQASLISADFGPQITNQHDFSGIETDAAAADAAFLSANVWNPLRVSDFGDPPTTDPVFNALKDSAGNATGVSFSISGSVNGFDFVSFYNASPVDALRHDMFFFVGRDTTPVINWAIAGLVANAEYRFYAYGARADQSRLFDMLVDTDGDDLLTDETSKALGSTGTDMQHYQDAYFASVFADANGVIHGQGTGRESIEANWSGFQLAQVVATVPEPAILALLGLGLAGLGFSRRKQ